MSPDRPCRQRGFTLVELLVSLTIFLIVSMGLLPLLHGGMRANLRNALHGEARRLAGEAMAVLQVADYAALPDFDGLASRGGAILLTRRIEADIPAAGQTRLTVTATWQTAGQRHRYQLQALRAVP